MLLLLTLFLSSLKVVSTSVFCALLNSLSTTTETSLFFPMSYQFHVKVVHFHSFLIVKTGGGRTLREGVVYNAHKLHFVLRFVRAHSIAIGDGEYSQVLYLFLNHCAVLSHDLITTRPIAHLPFCPNSHFHHFSSKKKKKNPLCYLFPEIARN